MDTDFLDAFPRVPVTRYKRLSEYAAADLARAVDAFVYAWSSVPRHTTESQEAPMGNYSSKPYANTHTVLWTTGGLDYARDVSAWGPKEAAEAIAHCLPEGVVFVVTTRTGPTLIPRPARRFIVKRETTTTVVPA